MIDPLFVDCYPPDGPKRWDTYIAAGTPWHGAIFKLSQGLHLEYAGWANAQRRLFLASPRYGVDLFDGMYHYLDIGQPGAAQADWFCQLVDQVGGEKLGTLWGMVDVERAGQRVPLDKARVEDCLSGFAERYEFRTGRKATLYGGELLRAIGAKGLYGCGRSAIALYSATLPRSIVERTGIDYEHLFLWQYDGDGVSYLPGYPKEAPGCGKIDISAMVMPGGLDWLRRSLWAEKPPR